MEAKTRGTSHSLLIVLLIILTFPIWSGIAGGMFGLATGLISGAFGLITGLFQVLISLVLLPFRLIFGWSDWGCDGFSLFHHRGLRIIAIIIVLGLLLHNRKKTVS
jgi:hypothetical protein